VIEWTSKFSKFRNIAEHSLRNLIIQKNNKLNILSVKNSFSKHFEYSIIKRFSFAYGIFMFLCISYYLLSDFILFSACPIIPEF
jgi:hypothetical protein